jgi:hypothetical protein
MQLKMIAFLPLLALPLAGIGHDAVATSKTASTGLMSPQSPAARKGALQAKLKQAKTKGAAKKAAVKEHWVCPMHDGGESDHAGKCPKCGMDLVKEAL